jgi:hypothetical protein
MRSNPPPSRHYTQPSGRIDFSASRVSSPRSANFASDLLQSRSGDLCARGDVYLRYCVHVMRARNDYDFSDRDYEKVRQRFCIRQPADARGLLNYAC